LLAACIVLPRGQGSIAWFAIIALLAIVILLQVGNWYRRHALAKKTVAAAHVASPLPRRQVVIAIAVLTLIFSKYFYLGLSTYYTFFLMERFGLTAQNAQIYFSTFSARSRSARWSADRSATASAAST
jgi:FSR family fosmidomycin resistance protein-like MFS transporter